MSKIGKKLLKTVQEAREIARALEKTLDVAMNDLPHERAFRVDRRAAALIRREERFRCIAAIWDHGGFTDDEKWIATYVIQKMKD